MQGSAASGLTKIAAETVSTVVTAAISVSGIAKRIVRASESTSAVVREMRSPVPARSTVESGRASTRRMKSSRSSAKICSERTNEARRASQVRIGLSDQEGGQHDHELVHVVARGSLVDGVDQATEQRRPGEAGRGRCCMEADDAQKRSLVAGAEDPRLPPQLRPVGDRQQLAHRSTPRVTVSR